MRVSINECKATVETHGYVHSDYPFTAYSGSATIEIKLSRKGGDDWKADVKMSTPRNSVKLKGALTGSVFVSTCP